MWTSHLAIAMQAFLAILDEIAKIEEVVNRNEDFTAIIDLLRDVKTTCF